MRSRNARAILTPPGLPGPRLKEPLSQTPPPTGDHYRCEAVSEHVHRRPRHVHQLIDTENGEDRLDRED